MTEYTKNLRSGTKVKMKPESNCSCPVCNKWKGKIVTFEKYKGEYHFSFEEDRGDLKVRDIEYLYMIPNEYFEL